MKEQDILDKISSISMAEELNINEILMCLASDDYIIRCDTIQLLSNFINNLEIENIILEKASDKNYLVRCEVYEALQNSQDDNMIYKLSKCLKGDRSSVARMYAASALLVLIKKMGCPEKIYMELKKNFSKEKEKNVIITYLTLFYLIEKKEEYIVEVLNYLNNNDYHIRCIVINTLSDVLDDKNRNIIKEAYMKRYTVETTNAVRSLLEKNI